MSLNLDFSTLLSNAFTIINNLWPVFAIPVGFSLGIGLLGWIVALVSKMFKKGGA